MNHLSKDDLHVILESGAWEKVLDCRYRFGYYQSVEAVGVHEYLRKYEESEKQAG